MRSKTDDQPEPIRIFFSWQSDLPPGSTTAAIRAALKVAASKLEGESTIRITLDEATRGVPGSPYIPFVLAEKIRAADIFVGDITTVATLATADDAPFKSLPNPNVTYELGVAAAHLGWNRIVLLFNSSLALFQGLPFDFDRHRISPYKMQDDKESQKREAASLQQLLKTALRLIIEENPKRPRELEGRPVEEIMRERDTETLRRIMRWIDTDIIDVFLAAMPKSLHWGGALIYDELNAQLNGTDFHLYDKKALKALKVFNRHLGDSLSYDQYYFDSRNPIMQTFRMRGDVFESNNQERAFSKIRLSCRKAQQALAELVSLIREHYVAIDLRETNKVAQARHGKILAEMAHD